MKGGAMDISAKREPACEPGVLAAMCRRWGEPAEVLELERVPLGRPGPGEVLLRMQAAPINPADINVIQGKYGFKPALPAFCGNEGVGVVMEIGPGVSNFRVGDLARPVPGVGTWREALVASARDLLPLPVGLPVEQAATLSVNPATAWRMLHDFGNLEPGDWVGLNAATSQVGRHLVRMARHMGLRALAVARRRDALRDLLDEGAALALSEEQAAGRGRLRDSLKGEKLKLAFNAVGGRSARNLALALDRGATMVTYGAMGLQPLEIPSGPLIFREIRLVGFWVTAWYGRASPGQVRGMMNELARLYHRGVVHTSIGARYPLMKLHDALAAAGGGNTGGKVILLL